MEHLDFLLKCLVEDNINELFQYLCNVNTKGLDILYYFSQIMELAYLSGKISKKIFEKSMFIYQSHHMPTDY